MPVWGVPYDLEARRLRVTEDDSQHGNDEPEQCCLNRKQGRVEVPPLVGQVAVQVTVHAMNAEASPQDDEDDSEDDKLTDEYRYARPSHLASPDRASAWLISCGPHSWRRQPPDHHGAR